jgi:hypothetical protein
VSCEMGTEVLSVVRTHEMFATESCNEFNVLLTLHHSDVIT